MEYISNGILALALGDVLGCPFEGKTRKNMNRLSIDSFDDLVKFQEKTNWIYTDDTSLSLASLDSLKNGYDLKDMMEKFSSWLYEGKYSSKGEAIGIGRGTKLSIDRFNDGFDSSFSGGIKDSDNGNGSLMRILPFVYYCYGKKDELSEEKIINIIEEGSSLTHQHFKSKIACGIYTFIVFRVLDNIVNKENLELNELINQGLDNSFKYYSKKEKMKNSFAAYKRIYEEDFKNLPIEEIHTSGYVLDTLESVLYVLYNTKSLKESILYSINLGEDTDTQAAISGSIAGLYYGVEDVLEYIENIQNIKEIKKIINNFNEL